MRWTRLKIAALYSLHCSFHCASLIFLYTVCFQRSFTCLLSTPFPSFWSSLGRADPSCCSITWIETTPQRELHAQDCTPHLLAKTNPQTSKFGQSSPNRPHCLPWYWSSLLLLHFNQSRGLRVRRPELSGGQAQPPQHPARMALAFQGWLAGGHPA